MKLMTYPRIGETVWRGTLPNGLPLCVIPKEQHAKSYAFFATRYGGMDLRFQKDGQWLDTPAGIAHYLEHKLFDTKEGNALQELAKNGAEPNAFTSNAMTAYFFSGTERFEESLKILLGFVSEPYFTKESVEKERGIIAQEIRMVEDDPEWQVYTRMLQCLYAKSTARISVAGTVESIADITAETLYDCHHTFYTPENMLLCVVGNVEPERIYELAAATLPERGEAKPSCRDYGEEPQAVAQKRSELEMEVSMPMFLTGFKCVPAAEGEDGMRRNIIGDMACDILLGDSSPLYARLYDQGLINGSFGGSFDLMPQTAYLYAGGDSKDPDKVRDAILEEAARLVREGVDDAYYQQVRKAIFGSTLRALNSFENIAISLTEGHFRGFDAFRFPELFDSISCQDVVDFLAENVVEERSVLSVIRPLQEEKQEETE